MSDTQIYVKSGLTGSGLYATMNGRLNWDAIKQRVDDIMQDAPKIGGAAVGAGRALRYFYPTPKSSSGRKKMPKTRVNDPNKQVIDPVKPRNHGQDPEKTNPTKTKRLSADDDPVTRDLLERRKNVLERYRELEENEAKMKSELKKAQKNLTSLKNDIKAHYKVKGKIFGNKDFLEQGTVREAVLDYLKNNGTIEEQINEEAKNRLIDLELEKFEKKRKPLYNKVKKQRLLIKTNTDNLEKLLQELGDIERELRLKRIASGRQYFLEIVRDTEREFQNLQQQIKEQYGITLDSPDKRIADVIDDPKLAERIEGRFGTTLDKISRRKSWATQRLQQLETADASVRKADSRELGKKVLQRHKANSSPGNKPQLRQAIDAAPKSPNANHNPAGTIPAQPQNAIENQSPSKGPGGVARMKAGLESFRNSKVNVAFGKLMNTPIAKFGGKALGIFGNVLLVGHALYKSLNEHSEHKDLARTAASFALRSGVSVGLTTGAAILGGVVGGAIGGPIGAFVL